VPADVRVTPTLAAGPGVVVSTKVRVAVPLELAAVTVKVVAPATVPVQPDNRPVDVLKLILATGVGVIA
jgi:hypothetical protein